MLLVDDLLLAPMYGLLWVFRKIHEAAQAEMLGEADAISEELRDLYMRLETGGITEAEFDARERTLLDRLEATREPESERDEEEDDEGQGDEEEGKDAGEEE